MKSTVLSTLKTFKLNNGLQIPIIGLGTSGIKEPEIVDTVIQTAYKAGYKMIDSAILYDNEKLIGESIQKFNIPREDFYIVTKIPSENVDPKRAEEMVYESLSNFKTDYLDLVLLHWPGFKDAKERVEVWQVLENFVDQGKIKTIGVSNFLPLHLKTILEKCKIKPAVNQFEIHPLYIDHETIEFCRQENIVITAYTAFARFHEKLINNPVLQDLCKKYNKQPSQILMRWCIQNEFVVIPRTSKKERILENIMVDDFTLTDEEIIALNNLNCNFKIIARCNPRTVSY